MWFILNANLNVKLTAGGGTGTAAGALQAVCEHAGSLFSHLHLWGRTRRRVSCSYRGRNKIGWNCQVTSVVQDDAAEWHKWTQCSWVRWLLPSLRSSFSRDWIVVTVVTMVPSGMMVRSTSTFFDGVTEDRRGVAFWHARKSLDSKYKSYGCRNIRSLA